MTTPASDSPGLRVGSLFSGYGGLDLAVEKAFGARTVWFSEINEPLADLFHRHWPQAASLGDITRVDWQEVPPVDVICGGFPCQDISTVGKHIGMGEGTRSGLWVHMAHAIEALKPQVVVIENVRGILTTPAKSLEPIATIQGGNDERSTNFAGSGSVGGVGSGGGRVGDGQGGSVRALGVVLGDLADLGMDARWIGLPAARIGVPHQRYRIFILAYPTASDPTSLRCQAQPGASRECESQERHCRTLSPTHSPCHQPTTLAIPDWGDYSTAIRRWQRIAGTTAPPAVVIPDSGPMQPNPVFVEWMMGLEPGWVTDPVHGLSIVEQLTALGNGVVPGQAYLALRILLGTFHAKNTRNPK